MWYLLRPAASLYLSQEDVVAAGGTDMAAMIDATARAFAVKAAGQAFMPPKPSLITWSGRPWAPRSATAGSRPCRRRWAGSSTSPAWKWSPSVPDNPKPTRLAAWSPCVVQPGRPGSAGGHGRGCAPCARGGDRPCGAVPRVLDRGVACLIGAGVLAHTQLDALRVAMPSCAAVSLLLRRAVRGPRGGPPRPVDAPTGGERRGGGARRGRRRARDAWRAPRLRATGSTRASPSSVAA